MRIRTLACGFVLGIVAAAGVNQAFSQDNKAGKAPSPDEMKKMMEGMQKWMKTMQPGEHHKAFEKMVGTWETTTKMWMEDPKAEPLVTQGTAERTWALGKRFVVDKMNSEIMMPDMTGQMKKIPWEGMGMHGYDNNRNMYVTCWADTTGTQLLTMKGTASPDGKTVTYYGEMDEPMLDVIGRMVKFQYKFVDDSTEVFTIYDLHAGEDYRVMEVTYKRKK